MITQCFELFLQEFFQSNLITKCFILFGVYKVTNLVFTIVNFFVSLVLPKIDLLNRFGQNSWALVTGASDGIGKALCFSLSKRGFNVVLIGRNKEKTQTVVDELQKKYPDIKYRIVIADFTQTLKDSQFINKIIEQVKDLDISILINDVGVDMSQLYKYYYQIPLQYIIDNINVNCSSYALLSHAIIPRLLKRQERSCVIDVGSFTALSKFPLLELYSSCKAFDVHLSRSLNQEYKSKIDFLTVIPLYVESNMNKPYQQAGVLGKLLSAEDFSEGTVNQICRAKISFGHYSHRILGSIFLSLPQFVLDSYCWKEALRLKEGIQKLK